MIFWWILDVQGAGKGVNVSWTYTRRCYYAIYLFIIIIIIIIITIYILEFFSPTFGVLVDVLLLKILDVSTYLLVWSCFLMIPCQTKRIFLVHSVKNYTFKRQDLKEICCTVWENQQAFVGISILALDVYLTYYRFQNSSTMDFKL